MPGGEQLVNWLSGYLVIWSIGGFANTTSVGARGADGLREDVSQFEGLSQDWRNFGRRQHAAAVNQL
jgi:hypothetical protein